MPTIRLGSLLLACFATLGTACDAPCGAPSTEIELFAQDREPLPPGVYEIEVELAGVSSWSVCEMEQGEAGELHCTSEGGSADGPPALTLWVAETGTEITGNLSGDPGELTLSVSHEGVEIARQELVLETEEVEQPGNGRTITCETLAPRIEVELVFEAP